MRVFVGLSLPDDVTARLSALVSALRPALEGARWTRAVDLHATTRFFGERSPDEVTAIARDLDTLRARSAFRVALRGVGAFPDATSPTVLWAGFVPSAELAALAADTERALSEGLAPEDRPYVPHVTLARIPRGARVARRAAAQAVAAHADVDLGELTVDEFHLYESRTTEDRRYHVLATFPLRVGA